MIQFKSFVLVSILFTGFGLAGTTEPKPGDPSESAAIQELVDRFGRAVNAKDVKAFGSVFAEDGEFTNPVGMSVKGRTAIEQFHAALFSESNRPSFAHAHLKLLDTGIRFIRLDVATVDVKWEQTGAIAPDGKPWGTRRGILSWVAVRDLGQWYVAVWHNLELPPQH
jgi:uncharacterized protein (TIGR02246 family)